MAPTTLDLRSLLPFFFLTSGGVSSDAKTSWNEQDASVNTQPESPCIYSEFLSDVKWPQRKFRWKHCLEIMLGKDRRQMLTVTLNFGVYSFFGFRNFDGVSIPTGEAACCCSWGVPGLFSSISFWISNSKLMSSLLFMAEVLQESFNFEHNHQSQ